MVFVGEENFLKKGRQCRQPNFGLAIANFKRIIYLFTVTSYFLLQLPPHPQLSKTLKNGFLFLTLFCAFDGNKIKFCYFRIESNLIKTMFERTIRPCHPERNEVKSNAERDT